MTPSQVEISFQDPVLESQGVFRSLLTAMSRPGEVVALDVDFRSPRPLSPAAGALLLTLADLETPVWLDAAADNEAVRNLLRFGCACPLTASPAEAAFAVVTKIDQAPPFTEFNVGTDEYPDRSTTLIIDVAELYDDRGAVLEGPGVESPRRFGFAPCPPAFWVQALDNHRLYPRGVDWIFCCGGTIVSLPRSTRPTEL